MSEVRTVLLKDICNFEKGSTGLMKAVPGKYPLVNTGKDRRSCESYQFDTKAVCIPLVSSTGHGHASLNNVHYQEGKFALGTILVALTAKDEEELDTHFLHLYISQLKDVVLVPLMKGAANVSLSITAIKGVEIPLPSITRQKNIVEKFKSIVEEEKELINELKYQQELLSSLNQQMLDDTIKGKVSSTWRNDNPNIESAKELLNRIKIEKEQLIKDKVIKKQSSLAPVNQRDLFPLPNKWEWCRLGDIAQIKGGKRVSNGYKLLKTPTPYIYIRVSDMKDRTISDSNLHYIDDEMHQKIKNYIITKKDLFIVIVGATIGKCGLVPEQFDGMNLTENAARIIPHSVDKDYLLWLLNSDFCQKQFIDRTKRVGVQKMALNRLMTTILPIPPLEEQKVIIKKFTELLSVSEQLKKIIAKNRISAALLMQAVLKEEFFNN